MLEFLKTAIKEEYSSPKERPAPGWKFLNFQNKDEFYSLFKDLDEAQETDVKNSIKNFHVIAYHKENKEYAVYGFGNSMDGVVCQLCTENLKDEVGAKEIELTLGEGNKFYSWLDKKDESKKSGKEFTQTLEEYKESFL